jgi:electron transfer flavoprotein beta subunit
VIAVTKEINEPRLPTVSAILKCYRKEIKKWTVSDIGVNPRQVGLEGSPTRVIDVFSPEVKRKRKIFEGTTDEAVEWIIEKLHEAGII